MRYAVLSDVHANAQALRAVVSSLKVADVRSVVCLGDVVGYGADPGEVIAVSRTLCEVTVAGNHDRAASARDSGFLFNQSASEAIVWTREQLSDEEVSYLAGLPLTSVYEETLLVHASPRNPGAWTYVTGRRSAAIALSAFEERLCLVGHTHRPAFYVSDGEKARRLSLPKLTMQDGRRYLVNVGSVGQPRDGDPRASYAVVDTNADTVEICRVAYDTELAGRRILAAGLPVFLAERLNHGG